MVPNSTEVTASDSQIQAYVAPETSNRVRLYLIDTAVKHTSTWFARNPKLSFKGTTRMYNKPTASKSFIHGTRMLGVIAGPETGAAENTPIDVFNYDVYPGAEGVSTTSATVAAAVSQARAHYLSTTPRLPSVICIASGSSSPDDDAMLEYYIRAAVDAGITVVVSAGNLGMDASNYIPAAYGVNAGVICVGACNPNKSPLSASNYGDPVDIYACGVDIPTVRFANPKTGYYDLMDGTSPAAGLITGAALVKLSQNPALTPAQVEAALVAAPSPALAPVAPPVAEADSDQDGAADVLEAFFGSNASDSTSKPAAPAISVASGQVTLSFSVAASLYSRSTPQAMSNGSSWKVQVSEDLTNWEDVTTTVESGTASEGLIPLTVTVPKSFSNAFVRVEVEPVPATE